MNKSGFKQNFGNKNVEVIQEKNYLLTILTNSLKTNFETPPSLPWTTEEFQDFFPMINWLILWYFPVADQGVLWLFPCDDCRIAQFPPPPQHTVENCGIFSFSFFIWSQSEFCNLLPWLIAEFSDFLLKLNDYIYEFFLWLMWWILWYLPVPPPHTHTPAMIQVTWSLQKNLNSEIKKNNESSV